MSRQLLSLCALVAASAPLFLCERHQKALRVLYGRTASVGKYPYVVALVSNIRRQCSGTLLTPAWVLTAAHCVDRGKCAATHVQYGNMSLFPNSTETKREIIERVIYPGNLERHYRNDIALVRIEPITLNRYGRLSAVDFTSLMGHAVKYAGYGTTEHNNDDDDRRPLLIGNGVVTSCLDFATDYSTYGAFLCVAPKCSNRDEDSGPGDSGGPLFYDEKIVGIVTGGIKTVGIYTTISNYITWLQQVTKPAKESKLRSTS